MNYIYVHKMFAVCYGLMLLISLLFGNIIDVIICAQILSISGVILYKQEEFTDLVRASLRKLFLAGAGVSLLLCFSYHTVMVGQVLIYFGYYIILLDKVERKNEK